MSSEASFQAASRSTLGRRRRQLLAGIASGAGVASALSTHSACGGGGPDDDATLRAVNAAMDVVSIDVQFNARHFAGAVACIARSVGRFAISTAKADGKSGSGNRGPAAAGQGGRSTGSDGHALLRAAGRC